MNTTTQFFTAYALFTIFAFSSITHTMNDQELIVSLKKQRALQEIGEEIKVQELFQELYDVNTTIDFTKIESLIPQLKTQKGFQKAFHISIAFCDPREVPKEFNTQDLLGIMKKLIEEQADVNYKTYDERPCLLHKAVAHEQPAVVKFLLEHKANADTKALLMNVSFNQDRSRILTPLGYAQEKHNEYYNDAKKRWHEKHPKVSTKSEAFKKFIAKDKKITTLNEIINLLQ